MNKSTSFLLCIFSISSFSCSAMEVEKKIQYAANLGSCVASRFTGIFGSHQNKQPIQSENETLVNPITKERQHSIDSLQKFNDDADFYKANPHDYYNMGRRWEMFRNLQPVKKEVLFYASYPHKNNPEKESRRIIIFNHVMRKLNDAEIHITSEKMEIYQYFINLATDFTINKNTNSVNFGASIAMLAGPDNSTMEVSEKEKNRLFDQRLNELLSELPELKQLLDLEKQVTEEQCRKEQEAQNKKRLEQLEKEELLQKQRAKIEQNKKKQEAKQKRITRQIEQEKLTEKNSQKNPIIKAIDRTIVTLTNINQATTVHAQKLELELEQTNIQLKKVELIVKTKEPNKEELRIAEQLKTEQDRKEAERKNKEKIEQAERIEKAKQEEQYKIEQDTAQQEIIKKAKIEEAKQQRAKTQKYILAGGTIIALIMWLYQNNHLNISPITDFIRNAIANNKFMNNIK